MHRFITSDIHFFHKRILDFCRNSRPFETVEQMNETIVSNWNNDVPVKNSQIWIIGDVSFGSMDDTVNIMNRLHGTKILIAGNHDRSYLKNPRFRELFSEIHDYKEIHAVGVRVCLFHFPVFEWHQIHRGSIHFHGHLHGGRTDIPGRIKDVGMDGNNMRVYDLDRLSTNMLKLNIRTHHGRVAKVD